MILVAWGRRCDVGFRGLVLMQAEVYKSEVVARGNWKCMDVSAIFGWERITGLL